MPVFRSGGRKAPAWCELDSFDIVEVKPGKTHVYERFGKRQKLIVGEGKCRVEFAGRVVDAGPGTNLDLTDALGAVRITDVSEPATPIRMCGHWGDETGASGIFAVSATDARPDRGDPVSYAKATGFDNHYHDCDEYWVLFRGHGVAVSEGRSFEVGPGDCVATGMGHHHDFPQVTEPVEAAYFETSLEGRKRRGHLWEHTHGPAQPRPERA